MGKKTSGLVIGGLLFGLGAGCVDQDDTTAADGNARLEIARFETSDTAQRTIVRGLDAAGKEVARLDLVHGSFTPAGVYKDEYGTDDVDGRSVGVMVHGRTYNFQTMGFQPITSLRAPSDWALAMFLDDPHVKPALEHWNVGYEPYTGPTPTADEAAFSHIEWSSGGYDYGETSGTGIEHWPNATYYGWMGDRIINSCGGSGELSLDAYRITQSDYWGQYIIPQCCPGASGYEHWFGLKACPTGPNFDYTPSFNMESGLTTLQRSYKNQPSCHVDNDCVSLGSSVFYSCRMPDPTTETPRRPGAGETGTCWKASPCKAVGSEPIINYSCYMSLDAGTVDWSYAPYASGWQCCNGVCGPDILSC